MPPRLDVHPGTSFGFWTTLEEVPPKKKNRRFLCRCQCGTEREVCLSSLVAGSSKCCGCVGDQKTSERNKIPADRNPSRIKISNLPEYVSWSHIKARCLNPKSKSWGDYGGRGITICDEWRNDFFAFYHHVGSRPSSDHSIGRIDNEKGYEPGNVRWETDIQQANNKRDSHFVVIDGVRKTLSEWCREYGVHSSRVLGRVKTGWDIVTAITTPAFKHGHRQADTTVCKRGHSYAEYAYVGKNDHRYCRVCARESYKRYGEKKREKR